jgi:hypothetical protein
MTTIHDTRLMFPRDLKQLKTNLTIKALSHHVVLRERRGNFVEERLFVLFAVFPRNFKSEHTTSFRYTTRSVSVMRLPRADRMEYRTNSIVLIV